MLNNFKSNISRSLINLKGWRTDKKIIIFESDDWGSIRMPSKMAFDSFQNKGYNLSKNSYCKYDTLANSADLRSLFSILLKHKDQYENHPIITANTVIANPNFDKIKESGFNEYTYKLFTETLNEYYPNENVLDIWKEGINKKIFYPQFHGREHVNVSLWLKLLKENNKAFIDAFNLGFWGVPKNLYEESKYNIQASYESAEQVDLEYYKQSIELGLKHFESIFGYKSKTFIANNYTWSSELNETLLKNGVLAFQGMKYQKEPNINGTKLISNYTGKQNKIGQVYMVRNCVFEPSQMSKTFNNVNNCLKGISNAFFFKKPAIIACHRLNFIGAIDKDNSCENLKMLDNLLTKIIKRWPDVIFMTSDQLAELIKKDEED